MILLVLLAWLGLNLLILGILSQRGQRRREYREQWQQDHPGLRYEDWCHLDPNRKADK